MLVRKGGFRLISGRRFPRVPGYDFAGTVEKLGEGASGVALGDEVYGMVNAWSGGTRADLVTLLFLWSIPGRRHTTSATICLDS